MIERLFVGSIQRYTLININISKRSVNLKCRLLEYNDTCICSCTGYLGSTKVDAVCDKLSKVNYDYEVRTNQCIVLQIGYDYEPINALSYRSATTMNRSMHCQLRL